MNHVKFLNNSNPDSFICFLCIEMNRNVQAQVAYDRTNKGVDIREASTANFLINSEDRQGYNSVGQDANSNQSAADFTITKKQSLMNGFFTRFGVTEVDLYWNMFNVSPTIGSKAPSYINPNLNTLQYGTTYVIFSTDISQYFITKTAAINLKPGCYNVKNALTSICSQLTAAATTINSGGPAYFWLGPSSNYYDAYAIYVTDTPSPDGTNIFPYYISGVEYDSPLGTPVNGFFWNTTSQGASTNGSGNTVRYPGMMEMMGVPTFYYGSPSNLANQFDIQKPYLMPYDFIDFTSPQLTANQDVKDISTGQNTPDCLYRWVFGTDSGSVLSYDSFGYPIYQGYKPFYERRVIPFPKQIRWDPLSPVGQVQFTIYNPYGEVLVISNQANISEAAEFKMLMLVSEV